MHRIVLVEFGVLLDLAHVDNDGRCATEKRIPRALVRLPRIDEVRNPLLENLAVDLDVRHGDESRGSASSTVSARDRNSPGKDVRLYRRGQNSAGGRGDRREPMGGGKENKI